MASQRARAAIMRWRDAEVRQEALDMLMGLHTMYGEQTAIVSKRVDAGSKISPETQARVWEALSAAI